MHLSGETDVACDHHNRRWAVIFLGAPPTKTKTHPVPLKAKAPSRVPLLGDGDARLALTAADRIGAKTGYFARNGGWLGGGITRAEDHEGQEKTTKRTPVCPSSGRVNIPILQHNEWVAVASVESSKSGTEFLGYREIPQRFDIVPLGHYTPEVR